MIEKDIKSLNTKIYWKVWTLGRQKECIRNGMKSNHVHYMPKLEITILESQ
jgi:hypothetical protein